MYSHTIPLLVAVAQLTNDTITKIVKSGYRCLLKHFRIDMNLHIHVRNSKISFNPIQVLTMHEEHAGSLRRVLVS